MDYSLLVIKLTLNKNQMKDLFGKNYENEKMFDKYDEIKVNEDNIKKIYKKNKIDPLIKYFFPSLNKSNLYIIVIRDFFKFHKAGKKDISTYKNKFIQLLQKITDYEHLINSNKENKEK